MSDRWDFYPLLVDSKPASIFVDLGIESQAPIARLPYMAYLRLTMNQPRPDGRSSQEEFDTLVRIEDAIVAALCGDDTVYVGRNTSNGYRDFYFYVAEKAPWKKRVKQAMASISGYRYTADAREDRAWSSYFNFLLPSDKNRQGMQNRRVLEELERQGDKLTQEREIDHWSYFPDQKAADAFILEVEALGYKVRGRPAQDSGEHPFGVQVWRVDVPSHDHIDEVTLPLFEAASRHGGEYDGWECPVEKS